MAGVNKDLIGKIFQAGLGDRDGTVIGTGEFTHQPADPDRKSPGDGTEITITRPGREFSGKGGKATTEQAPKQAVTAHAFRNITAGVGGAEGNDSPRPLLRKIMTQPPNHEPSQAVSDKMDLIPLHHGQKRIEPGGILRQIPGHAAIAELVHAKTGLAKTATQKKHLRAFHPQAMDKNNAFIHREDISRP